MKRKRPMTPAEALEKIQRVCVTAEYSTSEVLTRLSKWGINEMSRNKILELLIKDKFVDDRRFTESFVHDKLTFARWGRNKIRIALIKKRIPSDIISEALSEVDMECYIESLAKILAAKSRSIAEGNTYEGRTILFRFGVTRGFEPSIVSEVMRDYELWE